MEDINKKAKDDELNKAHEELSETPRRFISVPRKEKDNFFKCSECGKIFDIRKEGICSSTVLCDNCLKH